MDIFKEIGNWVKESLETIINELKKFERLARAATGQMENSSRSFVNQHQKEFQKIADNLESLQTSLADSAVSTLVNHIKNGNFEAAGSEIATLLSNQNVIEIIGSALEIDSFQSMSVNIGKEVDMVIGGVASKGIAIPINNRNSVSRPSVPITSVELDIGIQLGVSFALSFGFWKDTIDNLEGEGFMFSLTAAYGIGIGVNIYYNDNMQISGFAVSTAGGATIEGSAGYSWTSTNMQVWRDNQMFVPNMKVDDSGREGWVKRPGALKHVSCNNIGLVVGVNAQDNIYQWNGTGWDKLRGLLKQISTGGGEIWGVNNDDNIYRWNGTGWDKLPGLLKHVSVGGTGEVWGVNAEDNIYRWNGTGWDKMPGLLKQISVSKGPFGVQIWGVNAQDNIYRWNGTGWDQIPGQLKYISVGSIDSSIWGVNANDVIYRRAGDRWQQVRGRLKQISVGNNNVVWGVNADDEIYFSVDLS